MDIFSRPRSFFMKGQPIFYTPSGGLLSIVVAAFAILFFFYLAISWIKEKDMTINKFQIFNDDTLNWNTSAKIIIGLPHSAKEKVSLFRDFGIHKESPNFHECSIQEYTTFYETKSANFSLSYYCGDLIFPGLYDHNLVLAECSGEQNENFVLTPNLNCTFDPDFNETYFEYMVLTHRFNTFANPFKMTKILTQNLDPSDGNVQTIYLSYNKLIEYDQFQRVKESIYFTDLVNMDPPQSTEGRIFQLNILKDSEDYSNLSNLQIEVQGQNIATLLAMTLVIANILFQLCFYLNNIISDFLLRKYVLSLFKDELDIWAKISTIKEIQKNKKLSEELSNDNFIINIFSFKNNILFHLGVFLDIKTKRILQILNDEITKKLSIEIIQEKKFIFDKKKTSYSFLSKISNFLNFCDFMAPGFSFLIKKKERFTTTPGIILTFAYLCLLIVLFVFLGRDFYFKTNPHIFQIQSEDYNNKNDFDWDIPIMMYFPKEIAPFHNITYFNRSSAMPGLTNFTQCTLDELSKFQKNADPKFSYWCNNVKYYFTFKPDLWEDVYISIMECSDLRNSGFTDTGCVVNNFTNNNFFNVTIGTVFISKSIDISAFDLGIKNVAFDRNHTLPDMTSDTFEFDFQFTRQDVNDNSGTFFDTLDITRYSTFYNSSFFYFGSDLDNIADFYFRFQIHLVWSRVYIKFSEILAQIMAVAHVFWILFYFFNQFFEDYFFIDLFKNEFINKYFTADKVDIEGKQNLNAFHSNEGDIAGKIAIGERVRTKVFTFRNYLIYRLFGKKCWPNFFLLYESIYQEMVACVSLEGILKKKMNMTKESKIRNFLASFDYIGENRLIYFNSSNKYTTSLGGILSIVSFSLIFIFIIIFGSNFWYQMNPKITSYPARFYEMDPNDYKMNIPIMMDYSLNATDYLFFFNLNSFENKYETDFALRNCSFNDSTFFNVPFDSNKRYGCSNVNQELMFNYSNPGNMDANFRIIDCEHSGSCEINSSSNNYALPVNWTFNIEYLFPISVFNQNDPYHPITQEWIKYQNSSIIMFYLPKAEYDIINNQLYDDHGWILTDEKRNDFTSIINVNLKTSRGKGLMICFTYVTQMVRIMKRTYMKIPELLANIFAMLNLINQLVFFFYNLINRYHFNTYLYNNAKPINNQSKSKIQLPFYKFLAGMYFGFFLKIKDYEKIEQLYQNIFTLENILKSEINERTLSKKITTMADSKKVSIVKQDTLSHFCKTINNYEMVISTAKENNDNFENKESQEANEIIHDTYSKKEEGETEKIEIIEENNFNFNESKKE